MECKYSHDFLLASGHRATYGQRGSLFVTAGVSVESEGGGSRVYTIILSPNEIRFSSSTRLLYLTSQSSCCNDDTTGDT